jgi:hypothetical protein
LIFLYSVLCGTLLFKTRHSHRKWKFKFPQVSTNNHPLFFHTHNLGYKPWKITWRLSRMWKGKKNQLFLPIRASEPGNCTGTAYANPKVPGHYLTTGALHTPAHMLRKQSGDGPIQPLTFPVCCTPTRHHYRESKNSK